MHGWGGHAGEYFEFTETKNLFDNLIANGDIPPLIIVSATFYNQNSRTDFSGSIEENLRWGDENASMDEIREAAQSAQADQFITTFTNGYDTELGQGGVNVSGGQKQRLCIARALLKHPKILILDDSTSAVDTATEAAIRQAFRGELRDSTKLIIAQRISSVMEADKIVVMNDGAITGVGTHEQLLRENREYQEIYHSQMDGKEAA